MTKETKVGLFLIVCIALTVTMSAVLNKVDFLGSKGTNVTFYVDNAAGIVRKSLVMYRGIEVGLVTDVILENGNVAVKAVLYKDVALPNNIKVAVAQDGIVGPRYIDLIVDDSRLATGNMQSGDVYDNYKTTLTMDDLAESIQGISGEINTLVSSLNEVFATEKGKEDMKNILSNLNETTASLKSFTSDLDSLMTAEKEDLRAVISNLREITEKAKTSLDKIDTMTSSIAGTSDNVNKLVTKANEGEGTIGMLMSDNETRDKLKDTINGLYTMMEKSNQLVVELEGSLQYLARHDDYMGSFNVSLIPDDKKFYLLGLTGNPEGRIRTTTREYEITHSDGSVDTYTEKKREHESNTLGFNLQYGMMFTPYIGGRGGVFDSRLGFAVDVYPLANRDFIVSAQMSDFFRDDYGVYYKLTAKYHFWDYFSIQAGWNDIGSSEANSFFIGAGVRFIDNDLKYVLSSVPTGPLSD